MPRKSEDAKELKRARDRERDRRKEYQKRRESEEYKEKERAREQTRVRKGRSYKRVKMDDDKPDPWVVGDWVNGYIAKRDGNESYRPYLEMLHQSDLKTGTVRECVYETTPLPEDVRQGVPRAWQTNRGATLQFPGSPFIKMFKVQNPREQNPIPIAEGELVRRYLGQYRNGRRNLFPRCHYNNVINAPIFFHPEGPIDLLEWEVEYVDIKRCYSQLLSRLPSLAVNFNYAKRIYTTVDKLPPYDPQLLLSKHWGRAVVGMLRQKTGRYFVYGEPSTFPSRFYHGDTASWIHGILHVLATYAISDCGCFRWHTDGGFFAQNGGYKFVRFLNDIGIDSELRECSAVIFASLDQYEIVYADGTTKQTNGFLSTYTTDFVFSSADHGGSQRDNIIRGLDRNWMLNTLGGR